MSDTIPAEDNKQEAPTDTHATDTKASSGSSVVKVILVACVCIGIVLLLYYAYNRFVTNTISEPMVKGLQQERDDPVVDFNLRAAIEELKSIQTRVLGTLTQTADI